MPLTFNKFDLRDYLYHVYNVEVTGVRSFINQMAPKQRHGFGRWYRPRSQKMMIAELVEPFAWPENPVAKDLEAFDNKAFKGLTAERNAQMQEQYNLRDGVIPLRYEQPPTAAQKALKSQAKAFMENPALWLEGGSKGTKAWKEVEEDLKLPEGEPAEQQAGLPERQFKQGEPKQ